MKYLKYKFLIITWKGIFESSLEAFNLSMNYGNCHNWKIVTPNGAFIIKPKHTIIGETLGIKL